MITLSLSILFLAQNFGESKDYLIWDADRSPEKESGPALERSLRQSGYTGDYTADLTTYLDSLSNYCAVFVCLGSRPDNTILYDSMNVVNSLVEFLNTGGNLYIEGGETWAAWDNPKTLLHELIHIEGGRGGERSLLNHLYGISGKLAQNMVFPFRGKNSWIDSLVPIPPAETLFINWPPYTVCAVSYEDPRIGFKTIGAAFEFGGLQDTFHLGSPVGAKSILADSMMHFFGCIIPPSEPLLNEEEKNSKNIFIFPEPMLPSSIPPLIQKITPLLPFR